MQTQKLKTARLNASPFITLYLPSTPKQAVSYFALPGMKGLKDTPLTIRNDKHTATYIIDTICDYFKVDKHIVLGKPKFTEYVMPRQIIQWYLVNLCKMNYSKIGLLFGKDHSTIIHSEKVINDMLSAKYDNKYKTHVKNINIIL